MKKKSIIALFLLVILDQVIKYLVKTTRINFDLGFCNINYVTNTGGGFGLLNNDLFFIILLNLIIIIGIITYMAIKKNISDIGQSSLLLILVGGIGNFVDRIYRGYVIDYIDINKWLNFPVFNISDILISIGVILLVIAILIKY